MGCKSDQKLKQLPLYTETKILLKNSLHDPLHLK